MGQYQCNSTAYLTRSNRVFLESQPFNGNEKYDPTQSKIFSKMIVYCVSGGKRVLRTNTINPAVKLNIFSVLFYI